MEFVDFKVQRRAGTGKGVARKLRRQGQIPAILYGEGEPIPLTVESRGLLRVLGTEAGENVILNLTIIADGEESTQKAMVKEVQTDPVTGAFLHTDFLAISMERPIEVEVPVELLGVAKGVKEKAGILEQILRTVKVRCLPGAIPDKIVLDVSPLDIGDVLHVKGLPIPAGVELLADAEQVVVTVAAPAVEEVAAPAVEEIAEAAPVGGATPKEAAPTEPAGKPGAKTSPSKE
ncbi:MAG: 50S ribosomal protein L25 [Candidatus Methylomirabilales bacterium]